MSRTARVRVEASVQGLPGGSGGVSLDFTVEDAQHKRELKTLASGANTITVPDTDCSVCIFVPPTTNTQTITLKGVTGDTGIALDPVLPALIPLADVASFVLTAGAEIADCEIIWL